MAEAVELRGGGQQISNRIIGDKFKRGPWDGGDVVGKGTAQGGARVANKASPRPSRSPRRSPRPPASPRPSKGQFQGQGNGRQTAQRGVKQSSPRPASKPSAKKQSTKGGPLAFSKPGAPVLDRDRFRLPASLIPDIVIPFRVPRDQRIKLVARPALEMNTDVQLGLALKGFGGLGKELTVASTLVAKTSHMHAAHPHAPHPHGEITAVADVPAATAVTAPEEEEEEGEESAFDGMEEAQQDWLSMARQGMNVSRRQVYDHFLDPALKPDERALQKKKKEGFKKQVKMDNVKKKLNLALFKVKLGVSMNFANLEEEKHASLTHDGTFLE